MQNDIAQLRNEYKSRKLDREDLDSDPIQQFEKWLAEAIESKLKEPTAMTLATVDQKGYPSARIVLLKFVNRDGFAFFTNYDSRKGKELAQNKNVALVFYWGELERQVRVEGQIQKLEGEISERYFNSRPDKSRISAIISPQSEVIPDRNFLEKKVEEFLTQKREIKRPVNWGGYLVVPVRIEFWQGRENRLHDRFLYEKTSNNWKIVRLAP
ncbi:MAG: pyridoxamine 5'-phosphate oxidase [Melioribacteraceae bacterium]|nr:pyridoxamine 5'-phosphate oxidase [Melioribacteraceae bacterium]